MREQDEREAREQGEEVTIRKASKGERVDRRGKERMIERKWK